jgi:hypothetical protein
MPGYTIINEDGEEEDVWTAPTKEEIDEQDTEFLHTALTTYNNFKACGVLPYGGGYLQERNTTVEIIRILTQEANRYENWYMKNREALKDEGGEE